MRHYIVILLLLLLGIASHAQNETIRPLNDIYPVSPEAAKLGTYGNIPINLSSGQMNFTIPIYTIKSSNIEIPIYLSYSYSGFKVGSIPSEYGLGWTLVAGGVITRQVNGKPDESNNGYIGANKIGKNYVQKYYDGSISQQDLNNMIINSGNGFWDTQPDKFYLNAIDRINGTFYFNENEEPLFIPHKNYKIINEGLGNRFEVIDDIGNTYIFDEIERTTNVTEGIPNLPYNSAWFMSEFFDAKTKDKVRFKYKDHLIEQTSWSETEIKQNVMMYDPKCNCVNSRYESQSEATINSRMLDSIIFSTGFVNFDDDKIEIQDNQSNKITYILNYKNFEETGTIRKLVSIEQVSNAERIVLYQFDYFDGVPNYSTNKNYCYSQDFWGYYNGKDNTHFIPDFTGGNRNPDFNKSRSGALKEIIYPTGGKTIIDYEPNDYSMPFVTYNNSSFLSQLELKDTPKEKHSVTSRSYSYNNYDYVYNTDTFEIPSELTADIGYSIGGGMGCEGAVALVRIDGTGSPSPLCGNSLGDDCVTNSCIGLNMTYGTEQDPSSTYDSGCKTLLPGTYVISSEADGAYATCMSGISVSFYDIMPAEFVNVQVGGIRIAQIKNYTSDEDSEPSIVKKYNYINDDGFSSGNIFNDAIYYFKGTKNIVPCSESGALQEYKCNVEFAYSQSLSTLDNYSGVPVIYTRVEEKILSNTNDNGVKVMYFTSPKQLINLHREMLPFSPWLEYEWEKGKNKLVQNKKIENEEYNIVEETENMYSRIDLSNYGSDENNRIIGFKSYNAIPSITHRVENYDYENYILMNSDFLPISTITTDSLIGGGLTKTMEFVYSPFSLYLKETTLINSLNDEITKTKYYYPQDFDDNVENIGVLKSNNILNLPIKTETIKNGKLVNASIAKFNDNGALKEIYQWGIGVVNEPIHNNSNLFNYGGFYKTINYNYNTSNRLVEITKEGDISTSILWAYNNSFPIAKIENASYSVIESIINESDISLLNKSFDNAYINEKLDILRSTPILEHSLITSYNYKPLFGIISQTDPNSQMTRYEYDSFGRLKRVRDNLNNILKEYDYNLTPKFNYVSTEVIGNGTVLPSDKIKVEYGEKTILTFHPLEGYKLDGLSIDGETVEPMSPYTINNVTEDVDVLAIFKIKQYEVTTNIIGHGSISPSEEVLTVNHGSNIEYTFNPDQGHHVESIKVNNEFVGKSNLYNTGPIREDLNIQVNFHQDFLDGIVYNTDGITVLPGIEINLYELGYDPEQGHYETLYSSAITDNSGYYTLLLPIEHNINDFQVRINHPIYDFTADNTPTYYGINKNYTAKFKTYKITSSAEVNGTISPLGENTFTINEAVNYTISPDPDYYIGRITVNGKPISIKNNINIVANSDKTVNVGFSKKILGKVSNEGIGIEGVSIIAQKQIEEENQPIKIIKLGQTLSGSDGSFELSGLPIDDEFDLVFSNNDWICVPSGIFGKLISISTVTEPNEDYLNIETHPRTVNITISSTSGGTISPPGNSVVNYGSGKSYSFSPQSGYHIKDVKINGVSQGIIDSYTFSNLKTDQSIYAEFEVDAISGIVLNNDDVIPGANVEVYVLVNDPEQGMIENVLGASTTNSFGKFAIFGISGFSGHAFIRASKSGYNFCYVSQAITSPHQEGVIIKNCWTISASATSGGAISSLGDTEIVSGDSKTYTITQAAGHRIKDIKVDGATIGTNSIYTFSDIDQDHTIHAEFEIMKYSITSSKSGNGTISPSGSVSVNYNSNKTFTITPSSGYHISDVKVNNISQGTLNSYTFNNVKSNQSIHADFSINTYTISASSGSGGTITPSGKSIRNYGGSITYTFSPSTGYKIKDVKVNGNSVGTPSSYTFSNITSNKTIYVEFEKIKYLIYVENADDGTIISPATSYIEYGQTKTFSIQVLSGYTLLDVKVNGVSKGKITSYTFSNISSNQTLEAFSRASSGGPGGGLD
jgi:YD repeat-containing protein